MNDKKFLALSSVFFLMFIFGMGTLILQDPLSTFIQANTATVSGDKSFLTAIPQVGATTETIKVNVYIRDENGDLLPQKTVKLTTDLPAITIAPQDTQITDDNGKVEFTLTSATPGTAHLTAVETSSGTSVQNTVSVEFSP